MILLILLIFIGTNNKIYSSDKPNSLLKNSHIPLYYHQQCNKKEEYFTSYGSLNNDPDDDDNDYYIAPTRYVPTPRPKSLYYEYHDGNLHDPYENYWQEKETKKDSSQCKKVACGAISCATFLSVLGCLLFHPI